MEWDIQFDGIKIKEKQKELMSAFSDLLCAMKEYKTESDYLQKQWQGSAADIFFDKQNDMWIQIATYTEQTYKLLLALMETEELFAQGEREVERIMEEGMIWEI